MLKISDHLLLHEKNTKNLILHMNFFKYTDSTRERNRRLLLLVLRATVSSHLLSSIVDDDASDRMSSVAAEAESECSDPCSLNTSCQALTTSPPFDQTITYLSSTSPSFLSNHHGTIAVIITSITMSDNKEDTDVFDSLEREVKEYDKVRLLPHLVREIY